MFDLHLYERCNEAFDVHAWSDSADDGLVDIDEYNDWPNNDASVILFRIIDDMQQELIKILDYQIDRIAQEAAIKFADKFNELKDEK